MRGAARARAKRVVSEGAAGYLLALRGEVSAGCMVREAAGGFFLGSLSEGATAGKQRRGEWRRWRRVVGREGAEEGRHSQL